MPKAESTSPQPSGAWVLKPAASHLERAIQSRRNTTKKMFKQILYANIHEDNLPKIRGTKPTGVRSYTLFRMEQLLHELGTSRRDEILLMIYSDLFWLFEKGLRPEKLTNIHAAYSELAEVQMEERLSEFEEQIVIDHAVYAGILDFAQLPKGATLDYGALQITVSFAYRMIKEGIPEGTYFDEAILYIDTGDTLTHWELKKTDKRPEDVWIEFKGQDPLENRFYILKNEYYSFSDESLKALATVLETEQNLPVKSPGLLSYQSLVMGYFGVVERELRAIIHSRENVPANKRIMWKEIVDYVAQHELPILKKYVPQAAEALLALHAIRNKAAHGELVSRQEYEQVRDVFLERKLLLYLAWEKAGEEVPLPKGSVIVDFADRNKPRIWHANL